VYFSAGLETWFAHVQRYQPRPRQNIELFLRLGLQHWQAIRRNSK
jgi:hypothetical protein